MKRKAFPVSLFAPQQHEKEGKERNIEFPSDTPCRELEHEEQRVSGSKQHVMTQTKGGKGGGGGSDQGHSHNFSTEVKHESKGPQCNHNTLRETTVFAE